MPEAPAHGSLRKSTASGIAWLTAQSLGSRALGFLSQLVLAWILVPSDFAKIGLAYTISGISAAIVGFGIEDVLLHRSRSISRWAASGFCVSLGLGFVGMFITLIAGYVGAAIYDDSSLVTIVQILAIALPIGALSTIPSTRLRAAMNFRFLATYNIAENTLMQIMIIALAASGAGPYSFAIPVPILAALKAAVYWYNSPRFSNWRIKSTQWRYLISNGAASAGDRLLTESVSQCVVVVLGLLASQTTVGLYFFAFRLAAQPVRMMAGNFQNVILAALAQLTNEPDRQIEAAYKTARILAFVVVPVCFLQAALVRPFLLEFFGTKWQESIPLVQILSLGLPFDAVSWVVVALLKSRGQFRLVFLFSLLFAPIFILAVAIGTLMASALGASLAVAICYLTMPIFLAVMVFRWSKIPASRTLKIFVYPVVVAIQTIGGIYALSLLNVFSANLIVQGAFISIAGPALYIAAIAFWFPDVIIALGEVLPFRNRFAQSVLRRLSFRAVSATKG